MRFLCCCCLDYSWLLEKPDSCFVELKTFNFWSILAFQLDHWLVGNMLYLELIKFPVGDQHRSLSVVIKASGCLTALVVKSFFC